MSYLVLALLLLTVPGLLCLRALDIRQHKFTLTIALSYAYFTLIASVSKLQNLSLNLSYELFLAGLVALLVIVLFRSKNFKARDNTVALDAYYLLGMIAVGVLYIGYRFWAGPYVEMPADIYQHLAYAQWQDSGLHEGYLGRPTGLSGLLKQHAGIWYTFYAVVSHLVGLSLQQSLEQAMLLNGLVFLCVSFSFAWVIFGQLGFNRLQRLGAALLSTGFLFAHMGINVMSYLRYYTLAPTMLNFVFYYASIVLIEQLFNGQPARIRNGALLILFTLCAAIIHMQEALFIAVMFGLLLAWQVLVKPATNEATISSGSLLSRWWSNVSKAHLLLFGLMALATLCLIVLTHLNVERPGNWANKVLQLSEQGPLFNRILILNPQYQFVRVITIWGLFVYFLFVIFYRRFIPNAYLFMGMLVPLFTVFNPLFVDWFLRLDGPHTLWRLLYLVPLNLIAAASAVYCWQLMSTARAALKLGASIALVLLFVLLLPFKLGGFENPYSREILGQVETANSYALWQDMLDFLSEEVPAKKTILTDPVTGYAVSAFTAHKTFNYKFSASYSYANNRFNFNDYSHSPLKRFKGALIVVNERDGAYSETGAMTRHWPADIMAVSRYYSDALKLHLETNPDRFSKLWAAEDIAIYQIN